MTSALIGYTGYVGTTLRTQTTFDALFNSSNIAEIRGRSFSTVVCAAAPAAKYKANRDPEADRANLRSLAEHLAHLQAERFVLISTADVCGMPPAGKEDTIIDPATLEPYGRHRLELEHFVRQQFARVLVVRLPGLFGPGLRKNFLYDMVHSGHSEWTHADSRFQFYNMTRLWADLQLALQAEIPGGILHLATEPVSAAEVARLAFGITYTHQTPAPPARYDLHTRFTHLWHRTGPYIFSADEICQQIADFAREERARS